MFLLAFLILHEMFEQKMPLKTKNLGKAIVKASAKETFGVILKLQHSAPQSRAPGAH